MRRHNEPALAAIDARRAECLAAMSQRDKLAIERWRDPSLKGYTDFPLALMVGGFRMEDGDYAASEALFRSARGCVPLLSLWRLQCDWYLLKCHRRQNLEATAEDEQIANEATAIGELLRRTATKDKCSIERYCGLVYNLVGNDSAAIPCLESAARDIADAEGREVVVMLVDSYVRSGQKDRARTYLQSLARTSGMAPLANQLLAHIDASPP